MSTNDQSGMIGGIRIGLIYLVFSLAIISVGIYNFLEQRSSVYADAENKLTSIGTLKNTGIQQWYDDQKEAANLFYHNPIMTDFVQKQLQDNLSSEETVAVTQWVEKIKDTHFFTDIILLDEQGQIINTRYPFSGQVDAHIVRMLQASSKNQNIQFVDLFLLTDSQKPACAFIVPLVTADDNESVIGYTIIMIDPNIYLYPFISSWPDSSQTSESLIIRQEGNRVLFLNNLRFQPDAALKYSLPFDTLNLPAAEALRGRVGIYSGIDYRQHQVLSYTSHVTGPEWGLVVRMDESEVSQPLFRTFWVTVGIIAGILIIAGIIFAFILQYQRRILVSSHLEVEKALEISRVNFSKAFQSEQNLMMVARISDGVIIEVNQSLAACLALPRAAIIGKNFDQIFSNPPALFEEIQSIVNLNGRVFHRDADYETPDKQKINLIFSADYVMLQDQSCLLLTFNDVTAKKQIETQLQEQAQLHAVIIDAIVLVDEKFVIKTWNNGAVQMYGWQREEVIDKEFRKIIPTEYVTISRDEMLRKLSSEGVWSGEVIQIDKFGRRFSVITTLKVIKDELSKVSGVLAVSKDATQYRQAEAERQEKLKLEAQIRRLAESTPGVLCSFRSDASGKVSLPFAIGNTDEVYGLPMETLIDDASPIFEHIHPDDVQMVQETIAESARTMKTWRAEYRYEHPKRGEIWIEGRSSPIFDAKDGSITWHGFINDITDRKLVEILARDSQIRLRAALQAASMGTWIWDLKKNEIWWDESLEGLFYEKTEPLKPGNIEMFISAVDARDQQRVLDELNNAITERRNYYIEFRLQTDPTKERWYSGRGELLLDDEDEPLRLIGAFLEITDRKKIEESLRESEERYRLIVESLPLSVFIHSQDKIIYVNHSACELFGAYDESELLGLSEKDLVHPEDLLKILEKTKSGLARPVGEKDQATIEERIIRLDGEIRYVEAFAVRIEYRGDPALMIMFNDVTGKKQAELALRESEERYRLIVESLPLGVVIHRYNQIVFANQFALNLIGATKQSELLGRSVIEFVHPEDQPMIIELAQQGMEAAPGAIDTQAIEERLVRLDNDLIYAEASAARIEYQNEPALMVMLNDITGRKKAEMALRNSQERLKGFFASDLFGTLFGDVFGNIFEVNDEYLRIIGYTRNDFNSGRLRWDSITPEEFLQLDMESINEAKIRGACAPYEKQYIRKDGSRVWVLVGFVLFGDNRDESIAFIIDLTELKQKELEIRQLNEKLELRVQQRTQELEVANRELEAFAYSVSHDLRAPLRAIDGFSRIILDEYADVLDEEGQRLFGVVRENTSKMDQLITDLLALSRATRLEMKSIPIDMRLMAENVFNQVQYNYGEHPSELILEDLPLATGDPNLIQQVWVNLISNALKYSRPREFSRVEIACETKDGMQIYSVRDNGVGFNPAYINKLFGVFQRLHSADEFEGTGVGLAIVQRIIHRHGGRVWAEAEIGKGAKFYFSLPMKTG